MIFAPALLEYKYLDEHKQEHSFLSAWLSDCFLLTQALFSSFPPVGAKSDEKSCFMPCKPARSGLRRDVMRPALQEFNCLQSNSRNCGSLKSALASTGHRHAPSISSICGC